MYIKALVKRSRGEVNESLEILRKLYNFNENNLQSMKEIGKSLSLLGKYKMAIDIYNEVLLRNDDCSIAKLLHCYPIIFTIQFVFSQKIMLGKILALYNANLEYLLVMVI